MTEKNKTKNSWSHGVSPVDGKLQELWRKGFVEKMIFEPVVEDRRSNEW